MANRKDSRPVTKHVRSHASSSFSETSTGDYVATRNRRHSRSHSVSQINEILKSSLVCEGQKQEEHSTILRQRPDANTQRLTEIVTHLQDIINSQQHRSSPVDAAAKSENTRSRHDSFSYRSTGRSSMHTSSSSISRYGNGSSRSSYSSMVGATHTSNSSLQSPHNDKSTSSDHECCVRRHSTQSGKGDVRIKLSMRNIVRFTRNLKPDNWYDLGLCLSLENTTLDKIEQDHKGNINRQKTDMFSAWLRESKKPTWTDLVAALKNIKEMQVAQEIAGKVGIEVAEESEDEEGIREAYKEREETLEKDSVLQEFKQIDEELNLLTEDSACTRTDEECTSCTCTCIELIKERWRKMQDLVEHVEKCNPIPSHHLCSEAFAEARMASTSVFGRQQSLEIDEVKLQVDAITEKVKLYSRKIQEAERAMTSLTTTVEKHKLGIFQTLCGYKQLSCRYKLCCTRTYLDTLVSEVMKYHQESTQTEKRACDRVSSNGRLPSLTKAGSESVASQCSNAAAQPEQRSLQLPPLETQQKSQRVLSPLSPHSTTVHATLPAILQSRPLSLSSYPRSSNL